MENMMQQNKKWMNKNIRDYLSKAPILQKKNDQYRYKFCVMKIYSFRMLLNKILTHGFYQHDVGVDEEDYFYPISFYTNHPMYSLGKS